MIKRTISVAVLVLALVGLACSQRVNTFNVREYPGATVGDKTVRAQNACQSNMPCIIIFDPDLSLFPVGNMPAQCANCTWVDWRVSGLPVITGITPGGSTCAAGSSVIDRVALCRFHTRCEAEKRCRFPSLCWRCHRCPRYRGGSDVRG